MSTATIANDSEQMKAKTTTAASARRKKGQPVRDLTPRQRGVLNSIRRYIKDHGYPPSNRDVGEMNDLGNPNSAWCVLQVLQRKGYIKVTPGISRSIVLVGGRK